MARTITDAQNFGYSQDLTKDDIDLIIRDNPSSFQFPDSESGNTRQLDHGDTREGVVSSFKISAPRDADPSKNQRAVPAKLRCTMLGDDDLTYSFSCSQALYKKLEEGTRIRIKKTIVPPSPNKGMRNEEPVHYVAFDGFLGSEKNSAKGVASAIAGSQKPLTPAQKKKAAEAAKKAAGK